MELVSLCQPRLKRVADSCALGIGGKLQTRRRELLCFYSETANQIRADASIHSTYVTYFLSSRFAGHCWDDDNMYFRWDIRLLILENMRARWMHVSVGSVVFPCFHDNWGSDSLQVDLLRCDT